MARRDEPEMRAPDSESAALNSTSDGEPIARPTRPGTPDSARTDENITLPYLPPAVPAGELVPIGCGQVLRVQLMPAPAKESPQPAPPKPKLHPQEKLSKYWKNFEPEYYGKITRILPEVLTKQSDAHQASLDRQQSHSAARSYDEARAECIRAVERIKRECEEQNVRFSDPHFDIEADLKISCKRDYLGGLVSDSYPFTVPGDVKRVHEIFQNPRFFKDETSCDDVVQGSNSDCWFLSALSVLRSNYELVKRVCVIQAPAIGVYGFVFNRDGEWHQCIIDDKLYLRAPAYDEHGVDVLGSWNVVQKQPEDEYERVFQSGSKALQFAQCSNSDETWVPLLEKAYAKAHGDYQAINAGQSGEALEDLTGGVTTEIYTTNILDIDQFWTDELSHAGKDYLFSCGLACYRDWRQNLEDKSDRAVIERAVQEKRNSGLVASHAYAILGTYAGFGKRLVKIRNPWGHTGWRGAWSDGSKEWSEGDGDWLRRLNHKFGDDGVFWMEYRDFLRKFKYVDRTRIFAPDWHVASTWTAVQVPFSAPGYLETKFTITVPSNTPSVIVLSQLDDRYFSGLEGKYDYKLQFRVQKEGQDPNDYVARSRLNYELERSVNVECELEAEATYTVLIKVEAVKINRRSVETVIRKNIHRREKITQVGMSYDLAHQKAIPLSSTFIKQSLSILHDAATQEPEKKESDSSDDSASEKDPWNACCVVGLKVYSKLPDLSVGVSLPDEGIGQQQDEANLDLDVILDSEDPAKAALDQATIAPDLGIQEGDSATEKTPGDKAEQKYSQQHPKAEGGGNTPQASEKESAKKLEDKAGTTGNTGPSSEPTNEGGVKPTATTSDITASVDNIWSATSSASVATTSEARLEGNKDDSHGAENDTQKVGSSQHTGLQPSGTSSNTSADAPAVSCSPGVKDTQTQTTALSEPSSSNTIIVIDYSQS